jgi:hypothetical protein
MISLISLFNLNMILLGVDQKSFSFFLNDTKKIWKALNKRNMHIFKSKHKDNQAILVLDRHQI